MADIWCEKMLHGLQPLLRPADTESEKVLAAWSIGDVIRVKASKPRNGRNHRRFWKLLSVVAENLDDVTPTHLLTACKLKTGRCDPIIGPGGELVGWHPQSISFSSMDETEFREFYRDASQYLAANWLNVDEATLEQMVNLL